MKKFIAGVVLTVVAFMALTTGALAGGKSASRNGGSSSDSSNSKVDKGNSVCTYWYYYSDPDCTA